VALASRVDLEEAFMVGVEGVRAAVRGVSGSMVTLIREPGPEYRCRTGLVELREVANVARPLPAEFMDYHRHLPSQAFYEYALPLLGDPLPRYDVLRETRVRKLLAAR
jgi:6-phosphofructokinase 1